MNFQTDILDAGVEGSNFFKSQRRAFLEYHAVQTCIGIDYIESHRLTGPYWKLEVRFFAAGKDKKAGLPAGITRHNIVIHRLGHGRTFLHVEHVDAPGGGLVLTLKVKDTGPEHKNHPPVHPAATAQSSGEQNTGASPGYVLEIVNVPIIEPFFSHSTFYLQHTTTVDPLRRPEPAPRPPDKVEIDYLAKDYNSFRRTILDHLAQSVPRWKERHVPDMGITLVEIMAYAGDYLSYYQDAAATEAYLETARRRVSIGRHARLLDYRMHNGCNSRMPVQIMVNDICRVEKGTPLLSHVSGCDLRIPPEIYNQAILKRDFNVQVFETMSGATLSPLHNLMQFYTWGIPNALLPRGAVTAVLEGHFPDLKAGGLLVFQDQCRGCAQTHLVRLDRPPVPAVDTSVGVKITHIHWGVNDALPGDWIISRAQDTHNRAVVLGNILLVDDGRTIRGETLPPVPASGPYTPGLKFTNLVYAQPYDHQVMAARCAQQALAQDPALSVPAVSLTEYPYNLPGAGEIFSTATTATSGPLNRYPWTARSDLLDSGPFARNFVAECGEGNITLRFGDNIMGRRPSPHSTFKASYRIGSTLDSRAGINTVKHVVTGDGRITGVYNPCCGTSVISPEPLEQVRLNVPQAFKTQRRCITPQDWATVAKRNKAVGDVRVHIRWTGSWHTVFIYVARRAGRPSDEDFKHDFARYLQPFCPAGIDFRVLSPYYTGIDVQLTVYLQPGAQAGPVRQLLVDAFSTRDSLESGSAGAGGKKNSGFFYPGNFTFGTVVYLGQIIQRAMDVPGVLRVETDRFQRSGSTPPPPGQCPGQLTPGPLEIFRLDNISGIPDHGSMTFNLKKGRRVGR